MSDIQQGNEDISLTTARSWILPTTWMILEKDSSTEILCKSPAWPTPWSQPCESLDREPAWSPLLFLPDFWPMELWDNTWVLFKAAVLTNNRTLTYMFSNVPSLLPLDTLSTPPQLWQSNLSLYITKCLGGEGVKSLWLRTSGLHIQPLSVQLRRQWYKERGGHLEPYLYFMTIPITVFSELLNLAKRESDVEWGIL